MFGWGQPQSLDALELRARKTYGPNLDSSFYYTDQVLQLAPDSGNTEKYAWAFKLESNMFSENQCLRFGEPVFGMPVSPIAMHMTCLKTKSKALLNRVINYQQQSNYESFHRNWAIRVTSF